MFNNTLGRPTFPSEPSEAYRERELSKQLKVRGTVDAALSFLIDPFHMTSHSQTAPLLTSQNEADHWTTAA